MARLGGDAGKLGNQYESFWAVECFLEVVVGAKKSITFEAFGPESQGVEFHLTAANNSRKFFSSKRQNQKAYGWSISDLCKPAKDTSRSILGDLFQRVISNDCDKVVFVSASGANYLREIVERAKNVASFEELIEGLSKKLQDELQYRVLPLVGNDKVVALKCLKATEVISRQHGDQKRIAERRIESTLYRVDGEPNANDEIRILISEFVLENLGPEITIEEARGFLASKGYSLRDWKSDTAILSRVAATNRRFLGIAEAELINRTQISRCESKKIIELIDDPDSNGSLVLGPGGWGKSCVLAQVANVLKESSIPFLAIKLDSLEACETTRQLGSQLDLPASPVTVLAGVADGAKSVMIVDQIDAMSLVSGRNPKLWEVFRQLRDEVKDHPNVRFVLACRDFDLEHDHRLRQLGDQNSGLKKFPIGKLEQEEIESSLRLAKVDQAFELNKAQVEILGVPFHLLLYLLGDPERDFSKVAELYDRYWKRKQSNLRVRLGRESHWNEVIDVLAERMSKDQLLIAPKIVVSDWEHDAENMASENVIIAIDTETSRSYKFFHESFFDYAYARRFCSKGKGILDLLGQDEQHLFRRSQVRQILSFRRENDFGKYLKDVRDIFQSTDVRFHIKRMVASQFRLIETPLAAEWHLLRDYLFSGELASFLSGALRGHLGWFDLLNDLGVIKEWLSSHNDNIVDMAVWLLGQNEIHDCRSEEIAVLLLPYVEAGDVWRERIKRTLTWGKAYKSKSMRSIYLGLVANGAYDDFESGVGGSDFWSQHYKAEIEDPRFVIELMAIWFERAIDQFGGGAAWNCLDQCSQNKSPSGARMLLKAAECESKFFAKTFLPIVLNAVNMTEIEKEGLLENRIWPFLSNHRATYDLDDAILLALRDSLRWLARNDVICFRRLANLIIDSRYKTLAYLLLRSWAENPSEFADECVEYMISIPARLHIGYSGWVGDKGTGHCAVSRIAIRAISPVCSDASFKKLEEAVGVFLNEHERSSPARRGFYQLLVLRSLDVDRISKKTQLRIEELERKFPDTSDEIVVEDDSSRACLLYTSPSPRDRQKSRMPSSA